VGKLLYTYFFSIM